MDHGRPAQLQKSLSTTGTLDIIRRKEYHLRITDMN